MPSKLPSAPRRRSAGHFSIVDRLERRDLFAVFTVESPADDGPGTLRDAITLAEAAPGHDTIRFHLPGTTATIALLTPLKEITGPVTIDGTTQGTGPDGAPTVHVRPAYTGPADTLRLVGASGSVVRGLAVFGTSSAIRVVGGSGVVIEGNSIGHPGDDERIPIGDGVVLVGATDCRVGGTTPAQRNVIFGTISAVAVRAPVPATPGGPQPTGHVIQGNYLGLDATGGATVPTNARGIDINGTTGTLIGGSTPAERNVIVRSSAGVYILNGQAVIRGNYFGTDPTGAYAVPGLYGINVLGASSGNIIGGSQPGEGNVISGNRIGIFFFGNEVSDNVVAGNLVGLDAGGSYAVPNDADGVIISGNRNVIGGETPAARNVISGNGGTGLNLSGEANVVRHNYIGTDATGTRAIGNALGPTPNQHGLQTGGNGRANFIADNVISGNRVGVRVSGDRQVLQRNYIGTDASGTAAIPNVRGGIELGGTGADIGGPTADLGNVISGNGGYGLYVTAVPSLSPNPTPTFVRNNRIGVGADAAGGSDPTATGVPLGNAGAGVFVTWSTGTTVTDNTIAHNSGAGVVVTEGGTAIGVLGNSIHSNGGLGIDLVPTTRTDFPPNALQPAPTIVSVGTSDTQTFVRGTLQSTPGATFRIEFFSSPAADPSGYGEGETFLGSIQAAADGGGRLNFAASGLPVLPTGAVVTATASRVSGMAPGTAQTSEFSRAVAVPVPDVTGPRVTGVFVSGTQWTPAFLTQLVRNRIGTAGLGYAVPIGAAQIAPLPWSTVDQVSVRFSERISFQERNASLRGERFGGLAVAWTSYEDTTSTLTLKLARPLEADRFTLDVFADRVTDLAGNALDGAWTDTQPFPSGNGTRGRDFAFTLNVLPGDITRDGVVDASDALRLRDRMGSPAYGTTAGYSVLADVNTDGVVNVLDLATIRRRESTTLPVVESAIAIAASSSDRRARPSGRATLR